MRRTDRLRSLETIAGGFAHEIRNPLTSIKTFIQLAPDRKDDDEFMRDFSRIVLDDVQWADPDTRATIPHLARTGPLVVSR